MRSGAAYGGASQSVPAAREFVAGFLARLQHTHGIAVASRAAGAAELVVSELVANACKYAPGPCTVDVELTGTVLQITVRDTSPVLPIARAAEPGRIGQHGLELVLALCEGVEMQREPVGKRITARIALQPATGPDAARG
ncbi:ATP-binding protein [Streptomyces nanhaiensis]|uniref:ATP-binding protein n=1 Tax=Streptomyces nanhaiensis TaxID=679319 RepID=UPI00399C6F4E